MAYVVLDFETTGLNYTGEQVVVIAAIKLDHAFKEIGSFNTYVKLNKGKALPDFITLLLGITEEDLYNGMDEKSAMRTLIDFIGESTVVAHYAPVDLAFLAKAGFEPKRFICIKSLTMQAEPKENSNLIPTCQRLGIPLETAYRAIDDARAMAKLLEYRMKNDFDIEIFNTICVSPNRPLMFIPAYTKYILLKGGGIIADFTEVKEWF